MTDSQKLDLILEKVGAIEERMDTMEKRMDSMEEKMDTMGTDIRDIRLTLENEIRVNIQRVAEGHFDLSRLLHDAMRPSNEVEMLAVKVRMLETDVKELKARLA